MSDEIRQEPESPVDLELVTTKALLNEVQRRFDSGCIVAYAKRTGNSGARLVKPWGATPAILGLLEIAKKLILDDETDGVR